MSACVCCGGFINGAGIVSARGTALRYCGPACHDEYEAYLASCEQKRADIKAFRDWEDAMYAAATPGSLREGT